MAHAGGIHSFELLPVFRLRTAGPPRRPEGDLSHLRPACEDTLYGARAAEETLSLTRAFVSSLEVKTP